MVYDAQEHKHFGIILKGVFLFILLIFYHHILSNIIAIKMTKRDVIQKNIKFIGKAIKIYFGFNDNLFLKMILIYILWHLCSKRRHLTKRRPCQYFIDIM